MESNFNARFDQVDTQITYLQYDIYYFYERQGYKCQWAPFSHLPLQKGDNQGQGSPSQS